tara:strand:+ start:3606 stop:4718 length:1113 start_codon:yes stop_codon:yes gene_type:complete
MSPKKILEDIKQNNNQLFRSFLPSSDTNFNEFKNFKKFKTVIIIGMGGSILSSKAVYSFLKHKIKKDFVFIDNLDQSFLEKVKKKYNFSKTLFLIISKSGNTTETIINSSYFKAYLKKKNTIILSENKNNILREFARRKKLKFIKHNPNIGGRFSVFSNVGMLPAYLMGLKIKKFKKETVKFLKNNKMLNNSLKQFKKLNFKKNKILILFNYVPELNDFLSWCQQLMAESLGKNGKGFLPVISNAPKDHHSLLQLYLDGPKDKVFYIFYSKADKNLKLNYNFFGNKLNYLNNKKYNTIKLSQKKAFAEVLKKNKITFREISIKKFDESTLGKLFFLFIFETIALAKIMKVNPFDQPSVEKVKIITKKILS